MNDPIPDNTNRLGYVLGYLFHPFVLFVPSAFLVLKGDSFISALGWILLIGLLAIAPTAAYIYYLRRKEIYIYRREVRLPVYGVAWLGTLVCGVALVLLEAPHRLIACTVAILLWIPLQAAVNELHTKISGHAAFSMGVMVGLLLMGELESWWLKGIALAIVLLTAWARHITKHHTLQQILLGWAVASISVGISFALVL